MIAVLLWFTFISFIVIICRTWGEIMKIIINYDFIDAILNAKDGGNPIFRVVRQRRNTLALCFPIWLSTNLAINYDTPEIILPNMLACYAIAISIYMTADKINDNPLQQQALHRLRLLVSQMNGLGFNTDFNLLLQSEVYEKKLKIEFNEEKLPHLLQQKYILIPTYDYKGEVKETSFVQEHVVGSKEYVLSLGTPSRKRQVKLATAGA